MFSQTWPHCSYRWPLCIASVQG